MCYCPGHVGGRHSSLGSAGGEGRGGHHDDDDDDNNNNNDDDDGDGGKGGGEEYQLISRFSRLCQCEVRTDGFHNFGFLPGSPQR